MEKHNGFMVVDASGKYDAVTYLFGVNEQGGFYKTKEEAEIELAKVQKNPYFTCKVVKVEILIEDV